MALSIKLKTIRLLARFASPHLSSLWLVLALSVFAWGLLLTPAYFFYAHDAKHSVFFLVEFDQTFRDGFWWPRWSPDFAFGYGYPLFNMYAPLAFYAAEILHLLGLGFTATIKTMYVLTTIAAGLGMYGFSQRLFGRRAGLLAATVYMYAPFHLVEIFVRSAYAEFVALALIPFVFWAFTELIAVPTPRRVALAGLSYGLLALTHHTALFTFSPLLIVYLLVLILNGSNFRGVRHAYMPNGAARGRARSSNLDLLILSITKFKPRPLISTSATTLIAGVMGLALAAIYLLPVIAETRYIKIEQWTSGSYNYLQHFVYFAQLFSPEWGYGYAGPGLADDFSFQLGIVGIALVAFALVGMLTRSFPHRGTALFFFSATLVVIFLMSPLAESTWQIVPIATLVQFPWRLLGMTAFTIALVAGSLLAEKNCQHLIINGQWSISDLPTDSNLQSPISNLYLLCLVVILASLPYTQPQYTEIPAWTETPLAVINWDRGSIVDRVGMVAATQEQPQTSLLVAQYKNGEPLTAAAITAGQGTVETLHRGGASSRVKVVAAEPITLQFYTYDYPGWQVTLDGQLLPHRAEPPFGLITVDLPAGEQVVQLRMGSTPPRTIGTIISGLAVLSLLGLYLWPTIVRRLEIRDWRFKPTISNL